MPIRFLLLALVSLAAACRCGDRAEKPGKEATTSAPRVEATEVKAKRVTWALHVQTVTYADGTLSVLAGIAPPPSAKGSVERVFAGLSARRSDGTVVDAPLMELATTDLAGAQNLSHAFGPGFAEFALGVWSEAPPSCEEAPEECPSRLSHLADALVAHPKPDPTVDGPEMGKTDPNIGVRFGDAGGTTVMKAVRTATFAKVGAAYRGPRYRVSQIGSGKAPRDAKIAIRHRDLSDAATAEQVAAEVRKAVAGTEVVVEHMPDLDVEFLVVVGGSGTVAEGYAVDAEPVRMVRPGREKAPPFR